MRTLLLGLLLGSLGSGTASGSTSSGGSATSTARGDRGELGGTLSDQLYCILVSTQSLRIPSSRKWGRSYLVDVLALELRNELLETLIVSLDTDGLKDLLDVGGRGGGVATEPEKEVRSQVLHFDGLWG